VKTNASNGLCAPLGRTVARDTFCIANVAVKKLNQEENTAGSTAPALFSEKMYSWPKMLRSVDFTETRHSLHIISVRSLN
jgi:hypothetical protein